MFCNYFDFISNIVIVYIIRSNIFNFNVFNFNFFFFNMKWDISCYSNFMEIINSCFLNWEIWWRFRVIYFFIIWKDLYFSMIVFYIFNLMIFIIFFLFICLNYKFYMIIVIVYFYFSVFFKFIFISKLIRCIICIFFL